MSRTLKTAASALFIAMLLVVCAEYASYAATGKSMILGKTNSATKLTSLARTTSGPALRVTTKSVANPPFSVNGRGKVSNLNADRLDGLDSTSLLTRGYVRTGTTATPVDEFLLPLAVPAGRYLVTFSVGFVAGSGLDAVGCAVQVENGGPNGPHSVTTLPGSPIGAATSGAGYLTVPAGKSIELHCQSEGSEDFTVGAGEPAQLTATRVDQVVTGANVDLAP